MISRECREVTVRLNRPGTERRLVRESAIWTVRVTLTLTQHESAGCAEAHSLHRRASTRNETKWEQRALISSLKRARFSSVLTMACVEFIWKTGSKTVGPSHNLGDRRKWPDCWGISGSEASATARLGRSRLEFTRDAGAAEHLINRRSQPTKHGMCSWGSPPRHWRR